MDVASAGPNDADGANTESNPVCAPYGGSDEALTASFSSVGFSGILGGISAVSNLSIV